MRATEALHLSNPANKLDQDLKDVCTHCDYDRNKTEILAARKQNRKSLKLTGLFWQGVL